MELQRCENRVYFLPVNILTVGAPASWAARHTTVCLDYKVEVTFVCILNLYSDLKIQSCVCL